MEFGFENELQPCMRVHAYNPSTQAAEAEDGGFKASLGNSELNSRPQLCAETSYGTTWVEFPNPLLQ
jgi:hypothetical protein